MFLAQGVFATEINLSAGSKVTIKAGDEATVTCRGNGGGHSQPKSCLKVVCEAKPEMCDKYNLTSTTNSCKGVDGECLEAICSAQPDMCDKYNLTSTANNCKNKK